MRQKRWKFREWFWLALPVLLVIVGFLLAVYLNAVK
jgi:hypothetical protein